MLYGEKVIAYVKILSVNVQCALVQIIQMTGEWFPG